MIAGTPVLDLDDAESLEAADSGGALRSAASGGAQIRATAAAVDEGILERLDGLRPRSLVFVCGPGRATRAARLLITALGDRAGLPIVPVVAVPPWVGPLDVVVVAGDDAGDPRLVDAVDRAQRRGAEVIVAAPHEGPLRAVAAGRSALLSPRLPVLDHNRLLRYLAIGIAVLRAIDPARSAPSLPALGDLADLVDAEALRDGPQHEAFRNPAKTLATRMQQRALVLAGDSPAATELAGHAAEVLLQSAGRIATAVDLAGAVAAHPRMIAATGETAPDYDPLFHDEQLDGPAPVERMRVLVLSTDPDEVAARRKLAIFSGAGSGLVDADLVAADLELLRSDLTDPSAPKPEETEGETRARGGDLERLAVLALRLEMTAAYLRLIGAREVTTGAAPEQFGSDQFDGGRY
ncbi:tobH protein [Nocardia cyriacigeorgica]|uniref:tobH protein n=1 Tax=Nocardia cyriacigeorgica TaxID=135487 RepID=UPI0013D7366C|nr:tobH protein [Nocardia cyriacigeorgica]MBF6436617.1 tobH protein [Nocardia cyriacigeorgica]MBF6452186.1 tobH protein [Nocardia cyriacigeorgica]MBF6477399.1 tobH protein [Nocardia cyriacigeorgica]MBF6549355.1 tobH protein [Nocardia cyriacigeorgica]NEW25251.1 tobH protein [Nocardia cyriacigeorgica]